ncbi:glycosyltransferase family 4 protein [Halorubrum sp. DTA98]|uniref:glycosyltransferase family 4 protein n=1 Tax=Halorubrum sp. DTA98 TaxID=3402163 RepID=UPI003AAE41D6
MNRILGFTALRPRELTEPLEAAGYEGTIVDVDAQRSLPVRVFEQIQRGLRDPVDDPDVVLVYNGTGVLGIVSLLFGWYYSAAVLVRVNGDVFRQHREKVEEFSDGDRYVAALLYSLLGTATRLTYSRADAFLVVSEELGRIVRSETNCPESRIAVVHNPVPDVAPPNDAELPIDVSEHDRILLTVTNLNYEGKFEGVKRIIDGIGTVLPEGVGYIVAGGGVYLQELRSYINETVPEARDRIHVPGYVDDVELLYDVADVFVYVSHIDGYPNAVLEAQAAELPVVANEAHGMVEQIDDGRSGLLVDLDENAAIVAAVQRLLAEPDLRRRLGTEARRRVEHENAPERIGAEMLASIDAVLADERRRSPPTPTP